MDTIKTNLRTLRVAVGMSQAAIAKQLGTTQATIQRYEVGTCEAPHKVFLWYADYFDVSLDYIFCRTDKPQGKTYNYEPESFRKKLADKAEWEQFVKACFEPNSPLNNKLQDAILKLSEDGENGAD